MIDQQSSASEQDYASDRSAIGAGSNIDVFLVTPFLCSLKFLLFQLIGHSKRCLQKNIEHFLWLSFCDRTVPSTCSKSNVPSLWPWPMKVNFFQWIDNDPISVLYEFQIDISTNSWEIKYQNMGIGLLHVKRRTRQMTSDRHQSWHTDREYE